MKLRERHNTGLRMRAENKRRNARVLAFVQPHNFKPEMIGTLIGKIPTETPVADHQDQHS
jgi:hypothetical protein